MRTLLAGIVLLLVMGMKPGHLPVARVLVPVSTTDFECAELGRFDELCWSHNELTICATAEQGVEIVDTGIEEFGNRSLAPWELCFSDAEPGLRLTFDPPVIIGQMSVAQHPQTGLDRVRMFCWPLDGDLSTADLYEPDEAGGVHMFGLVANPGYGTCLVHGIVDDIRVFMLML